jgi:hypothetical protein
MAASCSWTFYLGIHDVSWLTGEIGPLFVSHRRLVLRANLPRAATRWALDSGGSPSWRCTVAGLRLQASTSRLRDETRPRSVLDWAAPMDWLCEPAMLARTGLIVEDHQRRTVANLPGAAGPRPRASYVPAPPGWDAQVGHARSNSVAYDHARSANSITGRVSVAIGVEPPAEGEHSHDVFHNSTWRGYEHEIHPIRIKQLWTGQAVVTTPGRGQPAIARNHHAQEARP